jgi:hypothetical protein
MGKEVTPLTDQKEQWAMLSRPGNTKVTLKRNILSLSFGKWYAYY